MNKKECLCVHMGVYECMRQKAERKRERGECMHACKICLKDPNVVW